MKHRTPADAAAALLLLVSATHGQPAAAQNLMPPPNAWQFHAWGTSTGTHSATSSGVTVTVATADGPRNIRLEAHDVSLSGGQAYHLHFLAAASAATQIEVAVTGPDGQLEHAALDRTVSVGTDWTPVDLDFRASPGLSNGLLTFCLGGAAAQYAISNASVTVADPASTSSAPSSMPPSLRSVAQNTNGPDWAVETTGTAQAGPVTSALGLIVVIDRIDGNPDDVAFARENVEVANGKTYLLHFRARSTVRRTVHVVAQDMATGHAAVGLSKDVELAPEWRQLDLPFTGKDSVSGRARIAIVLGSATGSVQLADVVFGSASSSTVTPSAPPRVVSTPSAGGVTAPIATWDLATAGSATALLNPTTSGAQVEIDRVDGVPDHVLLKQDGIGLSDGQAYELQFKAKSTVARRVPVIAQVDGGPAGSNFRMIGCNDAVRLTPEWQSYSVRFKASGTVPSHSRIAFLLGGSASTVELSDVALQPVDEGTVQAASTGL